MRVYEVKIEQLRTAPSDGCTVDSRDQNFRIALKNFSELTTCLNLLFDGRATFVRRLEDLTSAVVLAVATSALQLVLFDIQLRHAILLLYHYVDVRLDQRPQQCFAQVMILLQSEGVRDFGLVVAKQYRMLGQMVDRYRR